MSVVESLQGALAAEHAAVWGYGVVGAVAPPDRLPLVRAAQQAHRDRRDATAEDLRGLGAVPLQARADYTVPFAVETAPAGWALATLLEEGVAGGWRYVLGRSAPGDAQRTVALAALTSAAVQAVGWRLLAGVDPATVALPGFSP